jgi:L-threonylcarbamoyladenylate synthase
MNSKVNLAIQNCVEQIRQGRIIAYPTESCFGLGCDPNCIDAIEKIYQLKHRPQQMPFIIIISEWAHLTRFDCIISDEDKTNLLASWPGPTTWLIPVKSSHRLSSEQNKIAVRMTAHPIAKALCDSWAGPIVSTSANPHGMPSALTAHDVEAYFGNAVDTILNGQIGTRSKPSDIFDLETKKQIR